MYFFNNTSAIVYFVGTRVSIYKIYIKHTGLRSTHKGWYYWRVYCMKITFSDISGFLNLSPSLSKESVYILKLCSRCTMKLNLQIIKFIELLVVSKISSFTGNPVRRCLLECTSSYGNELYIYIIYVWIHIFTEQYKCIYIKELSLWHKLKYSNATWWCKPLIFQHRLFDLTEFIV